MTEWFCTLLDTVPDVYFRYALYPRRGFAYVSPSVETLTGRTSAEFADDPDLCLSVIAPRDRRLLRPLLRARRARTVRLHVVRDDVAVPIEVKTVAVVRQRRLVAVEGIARLLVGTQAARLERPTEEADAPVQQRLAALMIEVHDLLHRVLPPAVEFARVRPAALLRLGEIVLDTDRLIVTESGRPVPLTPREVLLLRHLLERTGRIVTRQQLLEQVWNYTYTGDDRTVDVHISRLRRKLPSLRGRLSAVRNIGYRLEADDDARAVNA